MKIKKTEIAEMISQLERLISHAREMEAKFAVQIAKVHPNYRDSAINLIHYRTIRLHDIRELQDKLAFMGLSRLGKAEAHVMASIQTNKAILQSFIEDKKIKIDKARVSFSKGEKLLNRNAKELLGYRAKDRRVRIMVTQPTESANDYNLVEKMLEAGMNTARLNCAHDSPLEWEKMVENIHKASIKTRKKCKICMDLGGPKIRTGEIVLGPRVLKLRPERDIFGRMEKPLSVFLVPEDSFNTEHNFLQIPIAQSFLQKIQNGDVIVLKDTRDKLRKLKVKRKEGDYWVVAIKKTTYIETGMSIWIEREGLFLEDKIGLLPALEQCLLLETGDTLVLHKENSLGEPHLINEEGKITQNAHISCTSEAIFESVEEGEKILFDDGKIEGIIDEVFEDKLIIKITYAKIGGAKLRADKGINLPESNLRISGLTEKDKEDLPFVAQFANVVNLSFVNKALDVQELLDELDRLNTKKLGLILKIETQSGFNHLTEILLTAMQNYAVGVMIARGDLAIECGWENMGRIQEEILSLCQAAHIPVVWATQVLENLAKKGIPSRAEITDAAMSQRAECVMLNKGPHIIPAIEMLDQILKTMKNYQNKKAPMLPKMQIGSL
ncbi:MAG: pyruvate kinase [Bacteroidota bacterium]